MYTYYLKDEDMLELSHIPVIELFNEAANEDLVIFFKNLCQQVGSGFNYTNCYFWSELDDYEKANTKQFTGVCFENEAEDIAILTYDQLFYYIKLISARYIQSNENDRSQIEKLICDFENNFIK